MLLVEQHVKLWDMAKDGMKKIVPPPAVAALEGKVKGLMSGLRLLVSAGYKALLVSACASILQRTC